jgi:Ser/Thr protein kinase RdoA (MazF antagonist)
MSREEQAARRALGAWELAADRLSPLGRGLINQTWLVTAAGGQRYVLQRVAPIFPPEINRDMDVVTRRLLARGVTVPRVLPTRDGDLWVLQQGHTWRLLTWLPGDCHDALATGDQARSAGRLLARFHVAVDGLEHEFANPRLGVHDTERHLRSLRGALQEHAGHPRHGQVAPLGEAILAAASALPPLPATPDRVVHGDPKINNMLFAPATGEAAALVDLDTVGRMPLPLELGDAMRSWCNPVGEDGRSGRFSAELFAAAQSGYAESAAGWISADEVRAIVPATETIIVELAARFCADALNESYFGWDPARFASRSEHNEQRATGQLSLARSFADQREILSAHMSAIYGSLAD